MKVPFTNKIAVKMIAAFFIVILIPAIFSSVFIYYFSSAMIKTNVRQSTLQIAEQAADSISFAFHIGTDISDQIYSDTRIQKAVLEGRDNRNLTPQDELHKYVNFTINNIIYSSSFVKIVYIFQEQGVSWGSGTFNPVKLQQYDLGELDWVKEAKYKDGEYVWKGLQHDRFSGGGDNTELVVPIARVLKDFKTMDNIGVISVSLDGKALLDRIDKIELGETGRFFVVNEQGKIMIDPDLARINETVSNRELYQSIVAGDRPEFEFKMQGVNYYGVKHPLSNGWTMVGIVPIHEITGQLTALQTRILYSSLFFALLAIFVALFMARRITSPIKQLSRQMKQVGSGDLKVRTKIFTADEVGVLSKQFNSMIQRIEELVAQVRSEQANKQEAELRAVMHRINPHFLYNTLTNIRWLVKFNQTEKADQGIMALIRLLEANMGKKGNFITIEEELDIIAKFLVILEIRYDLRFDLHIEIDPALRSFVIPRMLLQPIVENSIFHGIVPKGTDGEIRISIHRDRADVLITISDNGKGLEAEQSSRLNNMEQAVTNGLVGIGIKHVFESTNLYFSPKSELTISSKEDEGTMTTLRLVPKEGGAA